MLLSDRHYSSPSARGCDNAGVRAYANDNRSHFFAGPSGGVACHGAGAARIFAIYENFSGKSVSVLLVYNSLFFHQSHP